MYGPLFYSKILLFGEYGIIKDSKGLSIPYNFYNGALKIDESSAIAHQQSNQNLERFSTYLENLQTDHVKLVSFDITKLKKDIEKGLALPVVINVYKDRSFDFIVKSTPAAILLKKAAGIEKGSATPQSNKVGKVTRKQLEDIVKQKEGDLNAAEMDQAVKIISGTARSMGIEVE